MPNPEYTPAQMANAIKALNVPLMEQKSITISDNGTTTITPSSGYDGISQVDVITNVSNNYTAGDEGKVVSNGALVAQTAHATVTQNGTYDTTTNNSVTVNIESVIVEALSATANGAYTAPEGTAYSPVTVAVDTDEWQRPADWPDLDSIQLSEELVYDLYLTYDLRKVDWPAFISLQDNGGTHTLERGHLEDGVFVSDENVSLTTWNTFKQALDGSHGDVQLFRYRCTQAGPFGFSNFDSWVASMQPCVEMVGKIGGTVLANADNNSFHTGFLEHVKLSGYANTWNGMYNGAYALKKLEFVDFSLSGTAANNFNPFKDAPLTSVDFSGVTFDRVLWLQGLTNISLISINCGTARVDYLNFNGKSPTREIYVQEISNSNSVLLNNAYFLSAASLNRIIDALESTTSAKTLNLGSVNQAKLTAAEIAVATGKGWTVA